MRSMSLFDSYQTNGFYDEMFDASGQPRPHYRKLYQRITAMSAADYTRRVHLADLTLVNQGITFVVYGDERGTEKPFPFDLIPRIIPADDWDQIDRGLKQRLTALNAFLHDVYHDQKILKDRVVPRDLVVNAAHFRPEFVGADPPCGVYVHICGTDLIRDADGTYRVLEDNLRTPSGVSYVLENRIILTRVLPQLFRDLAVRPVDHYTTQLMHNLRDLAPANGEGEPTVALLTPGIYNSAYFEHAFLAQQLGIELVEGRGLFVDNNIVYMKTTRGPQRVDVIYRRVDDDFLDPLVFNPDSYLGVPGLMGAYLAGNVTIANAVGTGIADDKALYSYVPDIIRFYLSEEPLLANVPTFRCREPSALSHVLANLGELVVKEVNGSGGYGMLVGPHATAAQREIFAAKLKANPANFIAQPTLPLSTCPASFESGVSPRHVDLRPFALTGSDGVRIVPGGLTRVALIEGSLVVNSSQGGGTKDTWVVDEDAPMGGH